MAQSPRTIRYLNTDLDLVAPFDPAALVAALGRSGLFALYPPQVDDAGEWHVTLEADGSVFDSPDRPAETIARHLSAIEALTLQEAELWGRCTLRELNIGYDCGDQPSAYNDGVSADILRRVAAAGMSLRITLYPPSPKDDEWSNPGPDDSVADPADLKSPDVSPPKG